MPTTKRSAKPARKPTIEELVKRSTKASKVPLHLGDLTTAHVVAQVFLAGSLGNGQL